MTAARARTGASLLLASGPMPLLLAANVPVTNHYVVVESGNRHGVLLGPFVTTDEAIAHVPVAEKLADKVDGWSVFYLFRVLRLPTNKPGKLMHMLQEAA